MITLCVREFAYFLYNVDLEKNNEMWLYRNVSIQLQMCLRDIADFLKLYI